MVDKNESEQAAAVTGEVSGEPTGAPTRRRLLQGIGAGSFAAFGMRPASGLVRIARRTRRATELSIHSHFTDRDRQASLHRSRPRHFLPHSTSLRTIARALKSCSTP